MSDKNLTTQQGALEVSSEVADFYRKNANVGSENLSTAIPQLKVTESNSKNEDAEGQHVPEGNFYYSPTKESFKSVRVSIMTISRGFWALDNSKTPKPKFTQLVGGMLLDTLQPFVMFVSGTRLQNMWEFGKEIKPYTSSKQNPVPMFAFEVTLGLEKIENDYGTNHVVTYNVARSKNGHFAVLADLEVANMLRNGVDNIESMFESFIEQKEVDRNTGELLRNQNTKETFNEIVDAEAPEGYEDTEDVSDDTPF